MVYQLREFFSVEDFNNFKYGLRKDIDLVDFKPFYDWKTRQVVNILVLEEV
jgi:hypothetical protein